MSDLPPPGECWKYTPKPKGDASADPIFLAVGKALSSWETVEGEFASIFSSFLSAEHWGAQRAYGIIVGNRARREMLEAVAELFFRFRKVSSDDRKLFKLVMEHFQKASAIRNNIAHGYVTSFMMDGNDRGTFLVPPQYNSTKTTAFVMRDHTAPGEDISSVMGIDYRYTSGDIDGFSGKFRALAALAAKFHMTMTSYWPNA